MTKEEYIALFEKYLKGEATAAEKQQLEAFRDDFQLDEHPWEEEQMGDKEETKDLVLDRIHTGTKSRMRARITRWSIAASLFLGALSCLLFIKPAKHNKTPVSLAEASKPVQDIAPGGNKAILSIGGGASINLDSLKNGILPAEDGTQLLKRDGIISYASAVDTGDSAVWHTLFVPTGGQYQLVLQDGTKVWLNASSSLRFPPSFHNRERHVELTGEAYFEVAHQVNNNHQKIPFIVHVNRAGSEEIRINVLGTHFNVMAYENETSSTVTLLEGSVMLEKKNSTALLHPGEQANIIKTSESFYIGQADVEASVAWKNGKFFFNKADIASVMRQLERWYDIEVIYENGIPAQHFWGGIQRSLPLSAILEVLQQSGVKCRLEGRKLIVLK